MKLTNVLEIDKDKKYILIFDELTPDLAEGMAKNIYNLVESDDQMFSIIGLSAGEEPSKADTKELLEKINEEIERYKSQRTEVKDDNYLTGFYHALVQIRSFLLGEKE